MARHLPFEVNQKRKGCPLDGITHEVQLEIVIVDGVRPYQIPRLCLESLGIDVGRLSQRTYWFRSEDAARARAHHHAREVTDG